MDVSFTITSIRTPMLSIGCSDLLSMGVAQDGWLHQKRAVHNIAEKLRIGFLATGLFSWESCYVILHNGCLYVYKDTKQTKPDKAMSLFGYTQVLRAGELRQKDVAWPFKIVCVLDTNIKVHYFGAKSEQDMRNWMKKVKNEMILANNISYTDDSMTTDDYSDLETPISTRNYFESFQDLPDIRRALGNESDDEYTYPSESHPLNLNHVADEDDRSRVISSIAPPVPTARQRRPVSPGARAENSVPVTPRRPLPPTPVTASPPSDDVEALTTATTQRPQVPAKKKPAVPKKPPPVTPDSAVGDQSLANDDANSRSDDATVHSRQRTRRVGGSPLSPPSSASQSPSPTSPSCSANDGRLAEADPPANTPAIPPRSHNQARIVVNENYVVATDLEAAATWSGDPGEGNRLMMQLGEEGTYMIRSSVDCSSRTLLVVAEFQLRKYRVYEKKDEKYSLQAQFTHSFDSINQLLRFYTGNNLPNRQTKLSNPYSELTTPQTVQLM